MSVNSSTVQKSHCLRAVPSSTRTVTVVASSSAPPASVPVTVTFVPVAPTASETDDGVAVRVTPGEAHGVPVTSREGVPSVLSALVASTRTV